VISSSAHAHGGRRYATFAFTEQGVAMLARVLRSPTAIAVNIEIIRTSWGQNLILTPSPG
jgi:DNA-binding PadR family transcriptional regulator